MATINKTKSQTFQKIIGQQDINDILNQPNVTFKNNKGKNKQRHGGLTIKFSNDIDVNNKPSKVLVNGKLNNTTIISDINEVSVTETVTKEVTTQTETIEEKSIDNFSKYTYNSVTILEDKKIMELRKTIFSFKKDLEKIEEIERNLKEDLSTIRNNLFELELIELKLLRDDFNWLQKKKNNQILSDDDLKKFFFLKEKIEEIEEKISKFKKLKKQTIKKIDNNNTKINEINYKIYQLNQKLDKCNELSIPVTPPALWIKKSDELVKLEKQYLKTVEQQNKEKILKKISVLNKKMKKIWNDKKIGKIYEEILSINNEIYFIKTFVHFDNSITEEIMFFQKLTNDDIQVIQQIKNYQNINEYKKDIMLFENISTIKDNLSFSKISIKKFLSEQEKQKNWKISKSEIFVFVLVTLISITLLSLPISLPLVIPALSTIVWEKFLVAVAGLVIGQVGNKWITSLVEDKTKKVQSWMKQKFYSLMNKLPSLKNFGKTKEEENIKNDIKKTIKNLTSDKIETKLETQYEILKQELDNGKSKNPEKLISREPINQNLNNISKNLNIESESMQDFDSSIRDTVNHQEPQPSTSSGIRHSNLIS